MATSKDKKALFPPPFLLRDFFPAKWRACSQVISLETAQCENHSFTSQEVGQTDNDIMFFFSPQFQDFLDSEFLGEQVESIKELSNYINTLKRFSEQYYPLGEYQFDKVTLGGESKE